VASNKAINLLYQEMCAVLYWRTAVAIKMASIFFTVSFALCGHWGNMEQVVTLWQPPVASGVALDMPHWEMLSVLLQRTRMAIKKACNRGALVFCCPFFCSL
jgi:hypothetical protein